MAITGPVLGPIQPHIRSPLSRGCTIIPLSTGTGSGERDQTQGRRLKPKGYPVRSPGSVRADQALRIRNCVSQQFVFQAVFMMAPSMTTPELTYFQRATSSLRASATIIGVFKRPAFRAMRSLNHSVKVDFGWCRSHSQESSTIVARNRGFPAFETPCSRLTLPLFQGEGARPA